MKKCFGCNEVYPAIKDYFFVSKDGKYGVRNLCKKCFTERSAIFKATPKSRERASIRNKKHYANNKKAYADRWQKYYAANSESLKEKAKIWSKNNLDKRRIIDNKWRENPQNRLSNNISRSIRQSLFNGKKGAHWENLVDFTKQELIKHLERQFVEGMTWNNYGKWHLDHRIPISVHNFTKPEHEDFKRCWSLNNLQPLWAVENQSKSANIDKHFQPSLLI